MGFLSTGDCLLLSVEMFSKINQITIDCPSNLYIVYNHSINLYNIILPFVVNDIFTINSEYLIENVQKMFKMKFIKLNRKKQVNMNTLH